MKSASAAAQRATDDEEERESRIRRMLSRGFGCVHSPKYAGDRKTKWL